MVSGIKRDLVVVLEEKKKKKKGVAGKTCQAYLQQV